MYVLFGNGVYGEKCLELIKKENVAYFVDNDMLKRNINSLIPVYMFDEKKEELRTGKYEVVISASYHHVKEMEYQLVSEGIKKYCTFQDIQTEEIKKRMAKRIDYCAVYQKAKKWIHDYTVHGKGISSSTTCTLPYPEVSGYFIPTLLRWGERNLAQSYARWLCSIQKTDGSWYDMENRMPYVFDTGQILKGLLAIRNIMPEAEKNIRKGCDWLLSNMESNGRLSSPRPEIWGDGRMMSELIHIYCLSPIRDAGRAFDENRYIKAAEKSLDYYLENYTDSIMEFSLLSHFYAYVIEGLIDMGRTEVAETAMKNIAKIQKKDGSVPAYKNVNWICSTGLFQLALIWYRLGDLGHGDNAFAYACKLQNESGGWYGSYPHPDFPNENNDYIPDGEISWASKYFLDALYYRSIASFENWKPGAVSDFIDRNDGRYKVVFHEIDAMQAETSLRILEAGCFHGRYLKHLILDFPNHQYFGMDISPIIMSAISDNRINKAVGSITNIPYDDKYFDVVYVCEALEHAIDIDNSIRELARVTKPGGKIIIVDKNIKRFGVFETEEWEQWFDEEALLNVIREYCSETHLIHDTGYEDNAIPELFSAWIGIVK